MASPDTDPKYYSDEHRPDLDEQQRIVEDVEGNSSDRSGLEVRDNLGKINAIKAEDSIPYRQN